jgi:hypothetical protein
MRFLMLLMLLIPTTSFAQATATGGGAITILDVVADRRMNRGQLDSCELVYSLAYEDYIYKNGGTTFLRGSFAFMGFTNAQDTPPAVVLKVTAFDRINDELKLSPLDYAYFSTNNKSYAGSETGVFATEDGGIMVGYNVLEHLELPNAIANNITVNITRYGGSSDVKIPFQINDVKGGAARSYLKCSDDLIAEIIKKLN